MVFFKYSSTDGKDLPEMVLKVVLKNITLTLCSHWLNSIGMNYALNYSPVLHQHTDDDGILSMPKCFFLRL